MIRIGNWSSHAFLRCCPLLMLLACAAPQASPAADDKPFAPDPGFVSLFDGKSLNGWSAAPNAYAVEDGNLICVAGGKGNLLTDKEYADFIMKFEFKLTPGANNGLGIHCPRLLEGNLHLDGIELQILDDTAEKYKTLQPYQYHGSIYGIVPAKQGALKPVGEWNQQQVTVKGRRITVIVNGTTTVDADLDEATKDGTMDKTPHPGLKRASGHIGFLGHGDRVDFRRLQLKDLSPLTYTSDTLDAVKRRLASKEAVLVDVREPAEWKEAHIEGAIPLPNSQLQKGLKAEAVADVLPKDKIIYTHCKAGSRSLSAAEELKSMGYDVRPLKPGIQDLLDAGFPRAK
jgi:rhodanese-related sulfurtransferase